MTSSFSKGLTDAGNGIYDILVDSHADADPTFGNKLVEGAQIIATQRAAEDMLERKDT